MSEETALCLARLSHQWAFFVLPLPLFFGLALILLRRAGRLRQPGRGNVLLFARLILTGLFGASLLLAAVTFFHVGCAQLVANSSTCLSNEKRIALGLLQYAQDYDDHLPSAERWAEKIARLAGGGGRNVFRCPSSHAASGYALNAAVAGRKLDDFGQTAEGLMLFEADAPTRSFAGGLTNASSMRHSGGQNVAYLDGHARWQPASQLPTLQWQPTLVRPGSP